MYIHIHTYKQFSVMRQHISPGPPFPQIRDVYSYRFNCFLTAYRKESTLFVPLAVRKPKLVLPLPLVGPYRLVAQLYLTGLPQAAIRNIHIHVYLHSGGRILGEQNIKFRIRFVGEQNIDNYYRAGRAV